MGRASKGSRKRDPERARSLSRSSMGREAMRGFMIVAMLLMPVAAFSQSGSSSGGSSSGGSSGGGASSAGSVSGGSIRSPSPSSVGGSSGIVSPPSTASNLSPTQAAPVGRSPVAPNVSPTQAAPVTAAPGEQVRPDPSQTLAAPVQSLVPSGGTRPGTADGAAPTAGGVAGRQTPSSPEVEAARVREMEAREAKFRASEERIRKLMRDICTGCDYRDPPTRSTAKNAPAKRGSRASAEPTETGALERE